MRLYGTPLRKSDRRNAERLDQPRPVIDLRGRACQDNHLTFRKIGRDPGNEFGRKLNWKDH
jgi:hypothetical protein